MDQWTSYRDFDPRDYNKVKDQAPVEMMQVIWGWDIHQWAAAIERVGIEGTTQYYMQKLQKEYLNRYKTAPLGMKLVGVSPVGNYDLAREIFRHTDQIELVPVTESEDIY